MKPNTIYLADDGIRCFEAPEKPDFKQLKKDKNYADYKFFTGFKDSDVYKQYEQALEYAMKQSVLFKDSVFIKAYTGIDFEKGKLYPVPSGYSIEIENKYTTPQKDGLETKYQDGSILYGTWASRLEHWKKINIQYAILIPKQQNK